MDDLFQELPGRLDRLADRLSATAFAPDPAVVRRRGRQGAAALGS